jgi:hypothetical protein
VRIHEATHRLTRRTTLRLAGAGTIGIAAAVAATACDRDDTRAAPDPLIAHERAARTDAATATAAVASLPDYAGALKTVAAERGAHADALHAEIARVAGVYSDGTVPTNSLDPATVTPIAGTPAGLGQLRDQISAAQRAAADTGHTLTGYRAGLLGSISAACAAQAAVLLR